MIKLYNTLSKKVEEFQSIEKGKVGMYTCGPTVYASQHIGNMRAYVTWDILRRVLEANGYQVTQIMNVTDVGHLFEEGEEARLGEDKLEYAAEAQGKNAWEIAKYYTDEFLEFLDELNIKRPTKLVKATDHIKEQVQLIETLERKGFTYKIDDGIYFDTSRFGKKSLGGNAKGIKPGARVEMVPGKRNPTDFALWKFSPKDKERQMEWDSPWGRGFPGWHIECSAMSMKYLGETFDIHTGGIDHISVHHTNEIAQSEAATGKTFVHFWLHNEFLLVDGGRMSKSLGNVYTLNDVCERGFGPLALRYLFLTAHYRDEINFTWKSLEAAQNAFNRLKEFMSPVHSRSNLSNEKFQSIDLFGKLRVNGEQSRTIERYREEFFSQLNNDLGTPGALAVVWEVIKSNVPSEDKRDLLLSFDEVLGLGLERVSRVGRVPQAVRRLVDEREKLRGQSKWEEADEIRKKVGNMGYLIKDTNEGPQVKKK